MTRTNGVEQKTLVAARTRLGRVLPGVVRFPAQTRADGSVWLRARARWSVPDTEPGRAVSEAPAGSLCTVEAAADFRSLAWRKLMQNALAGLMAITGRRAGMFARADIAELGRAYLRECLAVARAEGADLDDEGSGKSSTRSMPTRRTRARRSWPIAKPVGRWNGTSATGSCCAAGATTASRHPSAKSWSRCSQPRATGRADAGVSARTLAGHSG